MDQAAHIAGAGPSGEPRQCCAVLAEDDSQMRELLTGALQREGFVVTAVTDGVELVEAIRTMVAGSGEPDLVVSDVQMPRCTGITALTTLRKMSFSAPVLLITAFGDEDTHAQAIRLGASILDKPFDIYKFRTIAANLVRR